MPRARDYVQVWRRKAHLVTWDGEGLVTLVPYDLYWSQRLECTFVRVSSVGREGLWLRLRDLAGHWDWYGGTVRGFRVYDGWGPDGPCVPLTCMLFPTSQTDPDTGATYWRSDEGRLTWWTAPPQPMAHT